MTQNGHDDHDLAGVFQRLQSLLLSTSGIESFLQQLSELAAGAADQPISCGITARRDGQPLTVASSDQRASALGRESVRRRRGPLSARARHRRNNAHRGHRPGDPLAQLPGQGQGGRAAVLAEPAAHGGPHHGGRDEPVRIRDLGCLHRRRQEALRVVRRPSLRGPAADPGPSRGPGAARPDRPGSGLPQHHRPGPRQS